MTRLMVNVEMIGWLRRHLRSKLPEAAGIATVLEASGVQGVATAMPSKPDDEFRREAWLLKEVVSTHLNVVLRPVESTVRAALKLAPTMVTLVAPQQSGSHRNAPLPVTSDTGELTKWIGELRANKIVVSCFVRPHLDHVRAVMKLGADYVELDTRDYAEAEDAAAEQDALNTLSDLAVTANKLGLGVAAGHRLTYDNAAEVARLPHVESVHVGAAIFSRGLLTGLGQAVRDMIEVMHRK